MSERLAAAAPDWSMPEKSTTPSPARFRPRFRTLARYLLDGLGVLIGFALAGVAGGWMWHRIWTPPMGGVRKGEWFYEDYDALGRVVDGTTLFVLVGLCGGLLLGVLAALLARRSALLTLAAVVLGSALASYLTYRVGIGLGPTDPHTLAATAADGTRLPMNLTVEGRSPFVFWSLGGLIGLAVTYILTLSFVPVQQEPSRGERD